MELYESFEKDYASAFSPVNVFPEGGVEIHSFVLRAEVAEPQWEIPSGSLAGPDASAARTGTRPAIWDERCERIDTPIYDEDKLRPGNRFEGPAIVEAAYSTVVVGSGIRGRGRSDGESVDHQGDAMSLVASKRNRNADVPEHLRVTPLAITPSSVVEWIKPEKPSRARSSGAWSSFSPATTRSTTRRSPTSSTKRARSSSAAA